MTTDLPADFSLDPPAPTPGEPESVEARRTKYIARLSALQVAFDTACQQHDQSTDPAERRRLLATIAALRRRMLWYQFRIPGSIDLKSNSAAGRGSSTRLSDQIASLDPILSRIP